MSIVLKNKFTSCFGDSRARLALTLEQRLWLGPKVYGAFTFRIERLAGQSNSSALQEEEEEEVHKVIIMMIIIMQVAMLSFRAPS